MDKRKLHNETMGAASNEAKSANVSQNILIDNYHSYVAKEGLKLSLMDEDDLSNVPITPTKPSPRKKGKCVTTGNAMETDLADAP